MPETKEEMLAEIDRLDEWLNDMSDMLASDGSVPDSMWETYDRQFKAGLDRMAALRSTAEGFGWIS
jgi:hypothetical protein